jgi:multicomponent K+:H+ antiporter subunit E
MTALFARLIPMPVMSLAILMVWVAITDSFGLGNILLGSILALSLPTITRAFWPNPPHVVRPIAGIRLAFIVILDIVLANITVARQILGPASRLRPAFVEIPLDITDPFVASILGSIISLTPGTVTIEVDCKRRKLLTHALNVESEAEMIATIKRRYEAPLKEIFGC